ncbi:MAG: hypothetical protein JW760_12375 [Spirochaetales bacterium]|nr:hypothetical protein [Spirochaetales bacterium]
MKRTVLLLILSGAFLFSLTAEDLDGVYDLEPFIVLLPEGRLIHPEKPYAGQYFGIVEMSFLKGSFVRLKTLDNEYNGFYDVIGGDSDNLTVQVQLKTGGVFSLQLVSQAAGVFRYFYVFSSPPFLETVQTDDENLTEVLPSEKTSDKPGNLSRGEMTETPEVQETQAGTLITGIMRKISVE